MHYLLSIFKQKSSALATALSLLLAFNTAFLSLRKSLFSPFPDSQDPRFFYYVYIFLFGLILALTLKIHREKKVNWPKSIFLLLLPTAITLALSMIFLKPILNVSFYLFLGIYIFSSLIYFSHKSLANSPFPQSERQSFTKWFSCQKIFLPIVFLTMSVFLYFGSYNIAKFSAVDEALWTFDRIPSFWKNVSQTNWNKTNISDKPGITVAIISGTGMLNVDPKAYDPDLESSKNLNVEEMNSALRLPLVIFAALALGLFYFLIERLLGSTTAVFSTLFIGTSPILIGMSRIINPDAILWIFTPLSLLSFLVYQKRRLSFYLFFSGIMLGLALLTKYVANILYVYFLLIIVFEYVFNTSRYENSTPYKYLLFSIKSYAVLISTSLLTFYLLYPASWMRYDRIFEGTILSQAFTATLPFLIFTISLFLSDILFLKGKMGKYILNLLVKNKNKLALFISVFFVANIAFMMINVYSGMNFYDFEKILSSPKSSYKENGYIGFFISNFYPLIFAISPVALGSILFLSSKSTLDKHRTSREKFNVTSFLIIFILSYYFGTTLSNVASTSRYQIILYPLILIISGIGINEMYCYLKQKYSLKKNVLYLLCFLTILVLIFSLQTLKPFYASYASILLPKQNYLDVKDMGPGSYEVAEYLNSLPEPQNITIWTDKMGVCSFFKGKCYGDLSYKDLEGVNLDYVAVSWGRENRTTNMVRSQGKLATHEVFNFAKYYKQTENVVFELLINDRPSQYIKVIKVK